MTIKSLTVVSSENKTLASAIQQWQELVEYLYTWCANSDRSKGKKVFDLLIDRGSLKLPNIKCPENDVARGIKQLGLTLVFNANGFIITDGHYSIKLDFKQAKDTTKEPVIEADTFHLKA